MIIVKSEEICIRIISVAVIFCICLVTGRHDSDDSDSGLPHGFSFLGGSSRTRFKNELLHWRHSLQYRNDLILNRRRLSRNNLDRRQSTVNTQRPRGTNRHSIGRSRSSSRSIVSPYMFRHQQGLGSYFRTGVVDSNSVFFSYPAWYHRL